MFGWRKSEKQRWGEERDFYDNFLFSTTIQRRGGRGEVIERSKIIVYSIFLKKKLPPFFGDKKNSLLILFQKTLLSNIEWILIYVISSQLSCLFIN